MGFPLPLDGKTLKVRRHGLKSSSPRHRRRSDAGTSSAVAATCPVTGYTTSVESVRAQLLSRRGGRRDARLGLRIASNRQGAGRLYLAPTSVDTAAAVSATQELKTPNLKYIGDVSLVPDGQLNHLRGFFNVVLYGMTNGETVLTAPSARF